MADIVRAHGEAFARTHVLTPEQKAVLRDLARCRTAELGGHQDVCADCGHLQGLSYNSCRNRHCPKCQSLAQLRWVEQRMTRMLPTHAFHVVFTLPRPLRRLALANRKVVFDLLFASAAASLLDFGRDPKRLGAELGVTSVLHTWTRDLRFHPHVHCIVTGGGLSLDASQWVPSKKDFLFHVRPLAELFRGKLLDALRAAYDEGNLRFNGPAAPFADHEYFRKVCDKLQETRWVVYCKPPFGDKDQVFRYLGQYTHRVGISNHRLVAMDARGVTFRTRGQERVTLPAEQFLRRFVLHVLPKGFVKIRHHGLFAAGNIHTKLAAARALLAAATDKAASTAATAAPADGAAASTSSPAEQAATDKVPHDFRDVLLALTGVDLRQCDRCGAFAVVRRPLELPPHLCSPSPPTSAHPP